MSDEPLLSKRRRFQIEEAILIILVILSLVGIGITDYRPGDGYGYWLIMVFVFALAAMFIAWLQSKQSLNNLKEILRDQSLHWGASLLTVAAAFLIQESGRIDASSAGILISLILALSTILDGIRVGLRFSLLGVFLGISAVLSSYYPRSIWQEFVLAGSIIIAVILWEIWQSKKERDMTCIDQYAVFGKPISHSKSPFIHHAFAEQTKQKLVYQAVEVGPEEFGSRVKEFFARGGLGLNCTVPLKELAFRYADQTTERAELSKAVNTLIRRVDDSILGDNTDGVGLLRDLTTNHQISLRDRRILVLGAGGATRGILGPLLEQKPDRLFVANRTVGKALQLVKEFAHPLLAGGGLDALKGCQFDLIINATAASLSNELPPLNPDILAFAGDCYDLAYGNGATAFVKWGLACGAKTSLDGLGMLVEQAAEAFFIWRGVRPETASVIELLRSQQHQVKF